MSHQSGVDRVECFTIVDMIVLHLCVTLLYDVAFVRAYGLLSWFVCFDKFDCHRELFNTLLPVRTCLVDESSGVWCPGDKYIYCWA